MTPGRPPVSVFARALGEDFGRLHPRLQERFGFTSHSGHACVGAGVMERIWRGNACLTPFLRLGTMRNILFPETGSQVPFTIENHAYRDDFGRETLSFVRTFRFAAGRRRRFDAQMVFDEARGTVVDFLGTHQHVAVDLDVGVVHDGALRIRGSAQRLSAWSFAFPLPRGLSGDADLRESFDEGSSRFTIDVRVTNRHVGPVFGYRGSFAVAYPPVDSAAVGVRPLRERSYA